jgi:transcriptional regulator with XRE-family HTH domain
LVDGHIRFHFLYCLVAGNVNTRKRVGSTIRAYREARKISQEKLAERAELSRNFVGAVERGEDTLSVDALIRIAKALRIRPRDLLADI